jgi:GntR family transcriptional regulator, arabinose operon transcriptional repressor
MKKAVNQAKYYKLKEYLKEEILMGTIKPGDRIPSENVLSKEFSISRHTVRKAISILINDGYLQSEHGRGTYCVDRSKIRIGSKNIGVITTYISEYIFPKVIRGIDNVLSDNGYSIILKNTNNNTEKESICIKDMLDKNIEGLIIEPTKSALFSPNIKLYDALDNHNIPYVFIHGYYRGLEDKPYVILDDVSGMYAVVKYLAGLGHKNIVGIFKADDIQGLSRHKGYAMALADSQLPYNPDSVIWFHTEDKKVKPVSEMKRLIESDYEIDAAACYNDEIAFRVFQTINGMGLRVPDDISVTGFDDYYLSANCSVSLTTVTHPKEKLGAEAAELLLQILNSHGYTKNSLQKVVTPELVVKDSCRERNNVIFSRNGGGKI